MSTSSSPKKEKRFTKRKRPGPSTYLGCLRKQGKVTRHTYHVRADLLEKLRGYAYWERIGISELLNQILDEFFEDKKVKPKPPRKRLRYRR